MGSRFIPNSDNIKKKNKASIVQLLEEFKLKKRNCLDFGCTFFDVAGPSTTTSEFLRKGSR
jgi:hypothetical protein